MASIQDIVNVDENQLDDRSEMDKEGNIPTVSTNSSVFPGHVIRGHIAIPSQTHRSRTQDSSSLFHASSLLRPSTNSSRSIIAGTSCPDQHPSDTGTNPSMDPNLCGYGQGHHYSPGHVMPLSSSSPASSRTSVRPIGNMPGTGEVPYRLTPITGRVSRAKKGVPVHTCDICSPPKVGWSPICSLPL